MIDRMHGSGIAVLTLLLAACATAAPPVVAPSAGTTEVPTATSAGVARARADSLRYAYTEADVRFMTDMIGHHEQAVLISRWADTHDADDEIRRLAARIINAQQDEIRTMQRWLVNRNRPLPASTISSNDGGGAASAHSQHGGHGSHASMPGMLTAEELTRLDAARGRDFDVLFLRMMIRHHRGAVKMVEGLLATDRAAHDETVFKFANDVQVDQRTEVARMEKMLFARLTGADR